MDDLAMRVLLMLTLPCGEENGSSRSERRIGESLTETRLVSRPWNSAVVKLIFDNSKFRESYLNRCRNLMNG
jgi:hypothetical protein